MLDSYSIKDLEQRYGKSRSSIYVRINGLKDLGYAIEAKKDGQQVIYNSAHVSLLDQLDRYLQKPGASISRFPRADGSQELPVLQDTPKLSRKTQDTSPSQNELIMLVLEQMMQNAQAAPPIDPLKSLRQLQEAADNKWILDSAQLGEILGKKSLPTEDFDRGGWHFERVGKIEGRSSWRVRRSDGE